MAQEKKGSRKAPRPSRKNVVITPHKGGRTARLNLRVTPEFERKIKESAKVAELSVSDYIIKTMDDEMEKPNVGQKIKDLEAGRDGYEYGYITDENETTISVDFSYPAPDQHARILFAKSDEGEEWMRVSQPKQF